MADNVPTVGPWQADPELRRLFAAFLAEPRGPRGVLPGAPAATAYRRYLDANRQRLGIPDNYTLDPRTNGQTLYDPNQNQLRDALLTGGALAGGGAALGAALGPASATSSVSPGTGIPTAGGGVGVTAPTTAGTIAGTTAAGTSALDRMRQSLTSASGIASLASLVPALMATAKSGGSGGSGAGSDDLARLNAITEARMRRADPLHQVAVQLAFQRAPISARNGIALPNVPLPQ
jgi:hypothetical protein